MELPSDVPADALPDEATADAPEDAAPTDLLLVDTTVSGEGAADGAVGIDGGVVDTTASGGTTGADGTEESANGADVVTTSPSPSGAMMTPGMVQPGVAPPGMAPGIPQPGMVPGMMPAMAPAGMAMTPGMAMGTPLMGTPTTDAAAHAQIAMLEQVPPPRRLAP